MNQPQTAPGLAKLEALCGSTLRALAGQAQLQWGGQLLWDGQEPRELRAPHQTDVLAELPAQRAVTDGAAARRLFSNDPLHQVANPTEPLEQVIFDWLEQLRAESLINDDWPGVQSNLRQAFERWCEAFVNSGLTETTVGILIFTVAVTAWQRLNSQALPEKMQDVVEHTRAGLMSDLGAAWAGLRRDRSNQRAFQAHALAISRWVGRAVSQAQAEVPNGQPRQRHHANFGIRLNFQAPPPPTLPVAESGSSRTWSQVGERYRVYTRNYDQEVDVTTLVRRAQLQEWRATMDQALLALAPDLSQISRILVQGLSDQVTQTWMDGQEEGLVDAARLSQIVSSPHLRHVFKRENTQCRVDAAVTFLLDCSGSMKAQAETLSLMLDILGRALERIGVKVEVLGFSTRTWNGGRARRDWQRAGQPSAPGRLNELQHMVFKPHAQTWSRARLGLAALRRSDLFREGVDGEAVQWACDRLLRQAVTRRVLVVISDGCPMDTATHQSNDEHYLDQHLKQVVMGYLRESTLRILGLGLGLDLSAFYPDKQALDLSEGLTPRLLHRVARAIAAPKSLRAHR